MLDEGLIARFHAGYAKGADDACWEWQRSRHVKGYGQLKRTGERKQWYTHRLAYQIATGADPGRKQICHTCDNPPCVNPKHLFIGTSGDNHQDMKRKGRHLYGERNAMAVLTEHQVREIFALRSLYSQRDLGEKFGVAQVTIGRILRGERWSHLQVKE